MFGKKVIEGVTVVNAAKMGIIQVAAMKEALDMIPLIADDSSVNEIETIEGR